MTIPTVGQPIVVRKLLHNGTPSYTWEGIVVHSTEDSLVVEATFSRGPRDLGYVILEPDDLFVEFYYYREWFNVFQIFAADGTLKGWYCNIGRPPEMRDSDLYYVDLELDLFVYPDGRELVLDEDEFEALRDSGCTPTDVAGALAGLAKLQAWNRAGRLPVRESIQAR